MPTTKRVKKSPRSRSSDQIETLRRRNRELRKKLKEVEAERDSFRQTAHGYLKEQVTEDDLRRWEEEIQAIQQGRVETGSVLDVIKELRKGDKGLRKVRASIPLS